jgi:hypothetical protein
MLSNSLGSGLSSGFKTSFNVTQFSLTKISNEGNNQSFLWFLICEELCLMYLSARKQHGPNILQLNFGVLAAHSLKKKVFYWLGALYVIMLRIHTWCFRSTISNQKSNTFGWNPPTIWCPSGCMTVNVSFKVQLNSVITISVCAKPRL